MFIVNREINPKCKNLIHRYVTILQRLRWKVLRSWKSSRAYYVMNLILKLSKNVKKLRNDACISWNLRNSIINELRFYLFIHGAFHAESTRLKPSLYIFFNPVRYRWSQRMFHANFQISLKISLAVMVDIGAEGRYWFVWNLHHKFFD